MSHYENQIAALRVRFIERLRDDNASLQALAKSDDPDRDTRIAEIAHRVAGMAGILGFPELTSLGKEADHAARATLDRTPIDAFIAAIARTIATL